MNPLPPSTRLLKLPCLSGSPTFSLSFASAPGCAGSSRRAYLVSLALCNPHHADRRYYIPCAGGSCRRRSLESSSASEAYAAGGSVGTRGVCEVLERALLLIVLAVFARLLPWFL